MCFIIFGQKMKLLTQEIIKTLPPLYLQDGVDDPIVQVKFFDPCGSFTWFVVEGSKQEDGDWLFFGRVISHLCPEGELGYLTLSELESVKGPLGLGIERDLYFKPKALSKCK